MGWKKAPGCKRVGEAKISWRCAEILEVGEEEDDGVAGGEEGGQRAADGK